jgi:hypothetical protein
MDIKNLVKTINDDPDPLHADVTPSVLQLIEKGLPAVRAVLDLLDAPELLTRKRAQRVLEGVVMRRHGWVAGQGYTDPDGQKKTQDLLADNGNYQAGAAPKARKRTIEKWRRWLESQHQ